MKETPAQDSEPEPPVSDPHWADQADRGRQARRPFEIQRKGWMDIVLRVWREVGDDRLTLIAAGVTFYMLLALVPTLAAVVTVYGLIADPATLRDHLAILDDVVPTEGMRIVSEQLDQLIARDDRELSFALVLSLALVLWAANAGMKAMFQAMNVAYGEREKRGFITFTLVTLGFTIGAIVLAVLFFVAVGAVPLIVGLFPLPAGLAWLLEFARWPLLLAATVFSLSVLYRFGPNRRRARWRWLTWGSVITAVVWLAISIGFSWYLSNFSSYDRTYGSIGAIVGVLMWMWISVLVVLVGAELNAEIEHQTAIDTTRGPDRPMGERGAVMADTVGVAAAKPDEDDRPDRPQQ